MSAGAVLLAGGEATRLPGKLTLPLKGVPLLLHVYREIGPKRVVVVACKGTFARELDALLDAPLVVDRWPRRGPLGGLLSAMPFVGSRLVFAIAGDAPLIGAAFLQSLERAWREGDEAVVPEVTDDRGRRHLEPLAALYERTAFLRAGYDELVHGGGSVAATVARLRTRRVELDAAQRLHSVNTPADYEAVRAQRPPNRPRS